VAGGSIKEEELVRINWLIPAKSRQDYTVVETKICFGKAKIPFAKMLCIL
jgi:hypothetical protein